MGEKIKSPSPEPRIAGRTSQPRVHPKQSPSRPGGRVMAPRVRPSPGQSADVSDPSPSLRRLKTPHQQLLSPDDTLAQQLEAVNENSVEESVLVTDHTQSIKMPAGAETPVALDGTQMSSMLRKNVHDKSREDKRSALIFAPADEDEASGDQQQLEAVDELESNDVESQQPGQQASALPEAMQKAEHDQMQHL